MDSGLSVGHEENLAITKAFQQKTQNVSALVLENSHFLDVLEHGDYPDVTPERMAVLKDYRTKDANELEAELFFFEHYSVRYLNHLIRLKGEYNPEEKFLEKYFEKKLNAASSSSFFNIFGKK